MAAETCFPGAPGGLESGPVRCIAGGTFVGLVVAVLFVVVRGPSEAEQRRRDVSALETVIRRCDERLAEDNDRLAMIQRRAELSGNDAAWLADLDAETRDSIRETLVRRARAQADLAALLTPSASSGAGSSR